RACTSSKATLLFSKRRTTPGSIAPNSPAAFCSSSWIQRSPDVARLALFRNPPLGGRGTPLHRTLRPHCHRLAARHSCAHAHPALAFPPAAHARQSHDRLLPKCALTVPPSAVAMRMTIGNAADGTGAARATTAAYAELKTSVLSSMLSRGAASGGVAGSMKAE